MIDWEIARHQVAISGRVIDAQTHAALADARIEIISAPAAFRDWLAVYAIQYGNRWAALLDRPDRVRSAADGHFHFLDLPDGEYTLIGTRPGTGRRYGSAQVTATITRTLDGHINWISVTLAVPPTTIKGVVFGPGASPVAMAEVRVNGSGERAFTNLQGQYLLTGLEVGDRTIQVSAMGYQPASQTVMLNAAGVEHIVNFQLA